MTGWGSERRQFSRGNSAPLKSDLKPLTVYGADILVGKSEKNDPTCDTAPVWTPRSGYNEEGLDLASRYLRLPSQLEAYQKQRSRSLLHPYFIVV